MPKIKVIQKIETKVEKEVDVEFPFYVEHDMGLDDSDFMTYVKVTERENITIERDDNYDGGVGIKIEHGWSHPSQFIPSEGGTYYGQWHWSTAERFNKVLAELKTIVENV